MNYVLSGGLILSVLLMSLANWLQPATFSAGAILATVIIAGLAVGYILVTDRSL